MDLTPRLLTEVEFKEQWRGYSPTEVDQFLARVATAVTELQQRLQEATDRAMSAERKLLERTDDDEIRRTLVLAQRTAASAVEEAQAEASRILEEARQRAGAEESAIAERTRAELADLTERRAALLGDVEALETFVTQQRERLRADLERQLAAVDDPSRLLGERPVLSGVDAPPAPEPYVPRLPTDEELARAREDLVEALRNAGIEQVAVDAPAAVEEPEPEPEPQVAPAAEVEPVADGPRLYDAADESGEIAVAAAPEDTQRFDVLADDDEVDDEQDADLLWAEPPTGEVPVAAEPGAPAAPDEEDDPFLAELRRAVTDESPLGPRDDDDRPPVLSREDDAVPSGRFRLRRGR